MAWATCISRCSGAMTFTAWSAWAMVSTTTMSPWSPSEARVMSARVDLAIWASMALSTLSA